MGSLFQKKGCKAVVFDMDGVLIDSEPLHFQVLGDFCAPLGFSLTWEEFTPFIGKDEVTFWEWAISRHGLTGSAESYIRGYVDRLHAFFHSATNLPPIDGVVELLQQLRREEIAIGLASSSAIGLSGTLWPPLALPVISTPWQGPIRWDIPSPIPQFISKR